MCTASHANAQGTSLAIVSFNLSNYSGGYNVTCNGATNGTFSITVAGGVTPYSYSWSNGATTPSITGIAAGAYTVTVTDASVSVATATLTATLLQPNLLTSTLTDVQHSGYDISCNGGNNGAITNTIGGGTAPYSFLWSDASVNQNYSNASAGSYSVTVTDMNNCSATATISMTQPSAITDTLTSPVNSFGFNTGCGIADGSVNLTVSGGVSTYTFSWNSGQHAQNLNYLLGGLYSVVITDQNGCTVNNTIAVISPPLLTAVNDSAVVYFNNANVSSDTSNDGIITAQPIGGTSPYTFQWSPGTFGTTQTITGCAAITGTGRAALYSVTVTDAAGCQNSLKNFMLTPAGSNDWNITGNHGEVGFIGTLDSADFIVKTNGTEAMRVAANGTITIEDTLIAPNLQFPNVTIFDTIRVGRIMTNAPDTILRLGDSTIFIYPYNMIGFSTGSENFTDISNSQVLGSGGGDIYRGLYIGNPVSYCNGNFNNTSILNNHNNMAWDNIMCTNIPPPPSATQSIAIGFMVNNASPTAAYSITMGSGDENNYLINSIPYSMMIGFNSNVPTVFVGPASGDGTSGNVGIGTSTPSQKLEIDYGNMLVKGTNNFGSAHDGAYLYLGDNNHYIRGSAGDGVFIGNYNDDLLFVSQSGQVGIGTSSPSQKLTIDGGGINFLNTNSTASYWTNSHWHIALETPMGYCWKTSDPVYNNTGKYLGYGMTANSGGWYWIVSGGIDNQDCDNTGNNPFYPMTLTVDPNNGYAPSLVVEQAQNTWCDYVFDPKYQRMSPEEKEKYVKEKKHLPDVASQKEIESKGLDITKTMGGITKNTEENTLDIIDLYKMLKAQQEKIDKLQKENENMKIKFSSLDKK